MVHSIIVTVSKYFLVWENNENVFDCAMCIILITCETYVLEFFINEILDFLLNFVAKLTVK